MKKIYIIIQSNLFGFDSFQIQEKKPDPSMWHSDGTKIYEAELIADYQSTNVIKGEEGENI